MQDLHDTNNKFSTNYTYCESYYSSLLKGLRTPVLLRISEDLAEYWSSLVAAFSHCIYWVFSRESRKDVTNEIEIAIPN